MRSLDALAALGLLLSLSVATSPAPLAGTEPLAEPSTPGSLEVVQEDGTRVEMPLRHTRVEIDVSAFVARSVIEQTFANPFERPVEAVYTFPLGDRAAVDDFEMVVGERTIRGEIRRRAEARRIYEEARSAGYRAALLEQERPNIFTQSVANIEPGAEITVRIRTVETLRYEAGTYELTFPLVVGPRYIPGAPASAAITPGRPEGAPGAGADATQAELAGSATTAPAAPTDAVPDADRITPPVLRPGFRSGHDVEIRVALDAGVPVGEVTSPSHRVALARPARSRARVRLEPADTIPNKDFILRWNVSSEKPAVGLLAHRDGVDGFFTLLVQPKGEVGPAEAMPKEIVLVLDTSGSMRGVPLEASKAFVRRALRNLGPRDTFNLIRFARNAEAFFEEPVHQDDASVERALRWVDELRGSGGTEMLRGLRAAFARPADPDRLRLVVFLTDGYIGNEPQILGAIGDALGEARIYTVGIGAAVNHYLLDRMAELGRGAYTFVRPDEGAERALERFRSWVTRPYLTDLEIDWGALPVADLVPERPRDLFSGQTLTVVGRYLGAAKGTVTVRGLLGGSHWEQRLEVRLPERETAHAPLASLWARHRIDELLMTSPGGATPAIRAEVTTLALEYRLMSPYTSFVAVDDSRVVNPDGEPRTVRQALPLPEGVSFEGVFGPQGPPVVRAAAPTVAPGDDDAAGLTVRVTDAGGPLPGATVTVSQLDELIEPRRETADVDGQVKLSGLPPGEGYSVAATFPGYAIQRIDDVSLGAGERRTLDLRLAERFAELAQVESLGYLGGSERAPVSELTAHDTPVPGRVYQNVIGPLPMAPPGKQDARARGKPGKHRRSRDFKVRVGGVSNVDPSIGALFDLSVDRPAPSATGAPRSPAAHALEAALRVLADLAEDGALSAAEGRPAVAALLAAQARDGAVADSVVVHTLATWALMEASAALPGDPWLRAAADAAKAWLAGLAGPTGWPARAGGDADPETSMWARLVLRRTDSSEAPGGSIPPSETSGRFTRVRAALAASRAKIPGEDLATRDPFDRWVHAIPRGHLKAVD